MSEPTDRCERCGASLDEPGTRCVGPCTNTPYAEPERFVCCRCGAAGAGAHTCRTGD